MAVLGSGYRVYINCFQFLSKTELKESFKEIKFYIFWKKSIIYLLSILPFSEMC